MDLAAAIKMLESDDEDDDDLFDTEEEEGDGDDDDDDDDDEDEDEDEDSESAIAIATTSTSAIRAPKCRASFVGCENACTPIKMPGQLRRGVRMTVLDVNGRILDVTMRSTSPVAKPKKKGEKEGKWWQQGWWGGGRNYRLGGGWRHERCERWCGCRSIGNNRAVVVDRPGE